MNNLSLASGQCYHCAEPNPPHTRHVVEFDGQPRELCCAGCEAVMRAIVEAGLADYYRFRTEPAALGVIPDDVSTELDSLTLYDEPEIQERFLHAVHEDGDDRLHGCQEINLTVDGLRCGACVWLLERAVNGLPGVYDAHFNFSTARSRVRFDATRVPISAILARIQQIGYRARPFDIQERELSLQRESRAFKKRLFIAGIAMMQVMMYALPAYVSGADELEPIHEQLFRWASLILTVPVMLISARPFLSSAWRDLKAFTPGMDVPVSLGLTAAFTASVWATISGRGEIYFDSVSMFVFLLLLARYLEWSARRRAMQALDDISAEVPESATLIAGTDTGTAVATPTRIPAVRLREGDVIEVESGARIPADAIVVSGRSEVDNALLTGESLPQPVAVGDSVSGGALLVGAPLQLQVTRPQASSTLSMISRLIDRGTSEKPMLVQTADRVAAYFVSVLLLMALAVFVLWWTIDPSRAGSVAIAVLVVSCPCALSVATPAALAAATSRLLHFRLLITRGHALESLSRVSHVVFDKTGTLTRGEPELMRQQTLAKDVSHARGAKGDRSSQSQPASAPAFWTSHTLSHVSPLAIVAHLERGSSHPFARAFVKAFAEAFAKASVKPSARQARPDKPVRLSDSERLAGTLVDIEHVAGHGIRACTGDGLELRLGSADWCRLSTDRLWCWRASDSVIERACSEVFLVASAGVDRSVHVVARFLLRDPLRSETPSVVQALVSHGFTVQLLSGDREAVVRALAQELNISQWVAGATPAQKQKHVKKLQYAGHRVLMVGDGINDAPVLATADVSLAVSQASALAQTAADVISLSPGIDRIIALLSKARATHRIVRQNLFWAVAYNLIAIPAAALGLIPPWLAAIGMASSSLLVAGNALRLLRDTSTDSSAADTHVRSTAWNRCSS